MSIDHKCFCRGDEVDSLELNKPEHLLPMMRPFSMRFLSHNTLIRNNVKVNVDLSNK